MEKELTLVIMAAGMGSRYGGLKQIEPVGPFGEYIIDYSIYDAIKAGFNKVVFIIKEENYDIFRTTVGKRLEGKIKVEYVFQALENLPHPFTPPYERVKPWGTGHAILCVEPVVDGPFGVINADDFYGREAFITLANFLRENADNNKYAIVGYKVKNTISVNGPVKRGVCLSEGEHLIGITESYIESVKNKIMVRPLDGKTQFSVAEDTLVSMNLLGFKPSLFNLLLDDFKEFLEKNINDLQSEFLIPDEINRHLHNPEIEVKLLSTDSKWIGITYQSDKEDMIKSIRALIDNGEYKANLWSEE